MLLMLGNMKKTSYINGLELLGLSLCFINFLISLEDYTYRGTVECVGYWNKTNENSDRELSIQIVNLDLVIKKASL